MSRVFLTRSFSAVVPLLIVVWWFIFLNNLIFVLILYLMLGLLATFMYVVCM